MLCAIEISWNATSPRNCSHEHLEPEIQSHDGNCLYICIPKVIFFWITTNRFPNHHKIPGPLWWFHHKDVFTRDWILLFSFISSPLSEENPENPPKFGRNPFGSRIESIESAVQRFQKVTFEHQKHPWGNFLKTIFPVILTSRASVAQLVRARDCQSLGRRFDAV